MSGKLIVQFTVNTDGTISDATLTRISIEVNKKTDADEKALEKSLQNEALRVVKNMPNWEPAYIENGEVVKSTMILPIVFKLPK